MHHCVRFVNAHALGTFNMLDLMIEFGPAIVGMVLFNAVVIQDPWCVLLNYWWAMCWGALDHDPWMHSAHAKHHLYTTNRYHIYLTSKGAFGLPNEPEKELIRKTIKF